MLMAGACTSSTMTASCAVHSNTVAAYLHVDGSDHGAEASDGGVFVVYNAGAAGATTTLVSCTVHSNMLAQPTRAAMVPAVVMPKLKAGACTSFTLPAYRTAGWITHTTTSITIVWSMRNRPR